MDLAGDPRALIQRGGALGLELGPAGLGEQRLGLLGLDAVGAPVASSQSDRGERRRIPEHGPEIRVAVARRPDLDREYADEEHDQQLRKRQVGTGGQHADDSQRQDAGVVVGGRGKATDSGEHQQAREQPPASPWRRHATARPHTEQRRRRDRQLRDAGGDTRVGSEHNDGGEHEGADP